MFTDGGFGEANIEQEVVSCAEKMKPIDDAVGLVKKRTYEVLKGIAPSEIDGQTLESAIALSETEPQMKDPALQSIALLKLSYVKALSYIIEGRIELGIEELRQTRDFSEDQQQAQGDEFENLWYEINNLIKEILAEQKSSEN